MSDCRNVMIYGELSDGGLSSITRELLTAGKRLARDLNEELSVFFVGDAVAEGAEQAYAFGADKVYVAEEPGLSRYEGDSYVGTLLQVVEKLTPRVLLFGNSDVGADLGPRLAFRLERSIATDCIALEVERETGTLLRTKPVYGGLAMAVLRSDGFPQMATLRPKSFSPAERSAPTQKQAIKLETTRSAVPGRVTVAERVIEEPEGVKLEDAEIIVSGGRGIGSPEGFKDLENVAKLLNGAVGGSRVAVDNGWIPTSLQVGLTGTIVAPRVYIAIGISGASQHMTGCGRSQIIIAINKDAAAPIFKQAHFGVVGDWKAILPAFVEKVKELG
jgi:electron transfer flavoprotein alpha subunit